LQLPSQAMGLLLKLREAVALTVTDQGRVLWVLCGASEEKVVEQHVQEAWG